MRLHTTFKYKIKELPKSLIKLAADECGRYSIPLIVNEQFMGSGTLVKIDNIHGVLTAEHVVNNPRDANLRLKCDSKSTQYFQTSIADFAHELKIPARLLSLFTTRRRCDFCGPDLAFIRIPDSPFLGEIQARKSFYNLAIDPKKRKKTALNDRGIMVVCGWPAEEQIEGRAELGFSSTKGLMGYGFITGQVEYDYRDALDYVEVGVSYKSYKNVPPESFAGVSGGGLWRVPVFRKAVETVNKAYYSRCYLSGVAFYQTDVRGRLRRIRCHGPRSIYEFFVPELIAHLNRRPRRAIIGV
jgi:hypothetical protein